jgi:glycosyltransferase involved in cell wall biosynthesis
MTRVLHILDHSLPMHSGYTFRTRAILTAQKALGLEVRGITGLRHTLDGPDTEEAEGLTFHRTRGEAKGPAGLREWREVGLLADAIVELAREWRPDVLHAHSPALCGLAGLRAAKRLGIPLVYEIRAFWEDAAVGNGTGREGNLRYNLTRKLEDYVVTRADAVVTICEGLKQDLVARGNAPERITIMPNGVDLTLFGDPPARDENFARDLGLGSGPVIGFIGSFYDYEGLDDLIDAMPVLIEHHPDARLLMVGGGPAPKPCAPRPRPARRRRRFALSAACRIRRWSVITPSATSWPIRAKKPAHRSGHAFETAGGHGAGQAGRGQRCGRPSRADRGWRDRHALPARRPESLRRGAGHAAFGPFQLGPSSCRRAQSCCAAPRLAPQCFSLSRCLPTLDRSGQQ